MTCSVLSLDACANQLASSFGNYFWWVHYWYIGVLIAGLLILLWVLGQIKNVAGVLGEVLFIGVLFFFVGVGFDEIKLYQNLHPVHVLTPARHR